MNQSEKIIFYNKFKDVIHPTIKTHQETKPLWRRLYWTTGRDSDEYKSGCVEILKNKFPILFKELNSN